MTEFGLAKTKREGAAVAYDGIVSSTTSDVETTYVERRIPVALEDAAHRLLDGFLRDNGFDPSIL